MPSIGRIQSTNFQSLLTELGITRNNIPFDLRSEVSPVVLVGGTVSFVAAPTPPYQITDIFTAGPITSPALGQIFADTGPLPVGTYTVTVWVSGTQVIQMGFEWRNAGNTADLWTQQIAIAGIQSTPFHAMVVRLDVQTADERFRVTALSTGTVGAIFQGSILAKI